LFNPYAKAILAAAVAIVAGLGTGIEDGALTTTDIVTAIVAGATALAVVWASHPLVKWLWGAAIAGASAFAVAVQDDAVTYAEWITIAAAVVGSLYLIYTTANTSATNSP